MEVANMTMQEQEAFEEEVFVYLDELRDSGVTNMYGAGPYIRDNFDVNREESHRILSKWMKTFAERHGKA